METQADRDEYVYRCELAGSDALTPLFSPLTIRGLRLPNRRHLKIAQGIATLGAALAQHERESISRKLTGQINEAANVEERSKLRRLGLNRLVSRLLLLEPNNRKRPMDASQSP